MPSNAHPSGAHVVWNAGNMARRRKKIQPLGLAVGGIVAMGVAVLAIPAVAYAAIFGFFFAAWALTMQAARRYERRLHWWSQTQTFINLDPIAFEHHVAETYRLFGYRTKVTPQSNDQGVDVLAENSSERLAIQCKRYRQPASNEAIQQVYAGATHYGCTKAIVVCTGGFTKSAHALAASTNTALLDRDDYAELVERARPLPTTFRLPPLRELVPSMICACAGLLLLVAEIVHG